MSILSENLIDGSEFGSLVSNRFLPQSFKSLLSLVVDLGLCLSLFLQRTNDILVFPAHFMGETTQNAKLKKNTSILNLIFRLF